MYDQGDDENFFHLIIVVQALCIKPATVSMDSYKESPIESAGSQMNNGDVNFHSTINICALPSLQVA